MEVVIVFVMVKLIIWFIIFFLWLFGKIEWNEIRTTFREWFPFLYFIYLFFFVVVPDSVQRFDFIDYTIGFLFVLSIYKDVFRALRYGIRYFEKGKSLMEFFDKIKKYLFKDKLEDISELLLATVLIGLVFIQIKCSIPTVNLINKSNIELLGFIIGIFSLYGIYIGFLQYLAGDVNLDTYLGKSKVNYLIEKSFWYYVTQSKLFVLMLLITVIVPIAVKLNIAFTKEFTVLWQTSYILLLIIYIFLLSMSLYIIRVAFLMKSKDDENLRYNMKKQIQQDYKETFWLIYHNRNRYVNDFIKNKLNRDFIKLGANEYEEFVENIFALDYFDSRNLYWSILNQIDTGFKLTRIQKFRNKFFTKFKIFDNRKWLETYEAKNTEDLEKEWRDFYKYLKLFIFSKWDFLKLHQANFSPKVWQKLIKEDLVILDKIVKNDKTLTIVKIEYPETDEVGFLPWYRDKNIREFLFQLLIDKEGINLDEILGDTIKEIKNFKEDSTDQFEEYTYDFLRFRLEKILDKYKNDSADLALPKFKKLSDQSVFEDGQRNDYENSMLYSKMCFDYLGEGRLENFSDATSEQEDNDEKKQEKIKAQRLQSLILSMNEEYRLAFMLYQLSYTDHTQWDNNLTFYDKEIRKIMNSDEQYHDYLFNQAKKIILSTNIDHRITERFLDKLWQTRFDKITSFSWFEQFGTRHQMSDLKLLYVQELLSGNHYSYAKSRFHITREFPMIVSSLLLGKIQKSEKQNLFAKDLKWRLQRKKERRSYFCRDYLLLTDQLPNVFTKESYSYEQNDLQVSVEYLLYSNKINLSKVIENVSVTSLLRLEWILQWDYYHYTKKSNYTSRTFFDAMTSNSRYYWSGGNGILEFYIVKVIDNFYHDLYQDKEFIDGLKYQLESQLNSLNKTVEEYVELISARVSEFQNISILQKGQIISKLQDILFRQDDRGKEKRKQYRYR